MKNIDKIISLEKHVAKLRTQLATSPRAGSNDYKNWVALEIRRTEKKIAELKS